MLPRLPPLSNAARDRPSPSAKSPMAGLPVVLLKSTWVESALVNPFGLLPTLSSLKSMVIEVVLAANGDGAATELAP
jgi:hypothetical protein